MIRENISWNSASFLYYGFSVITNWKFQKRNNYREYFFLDETKPSVLDLRFYL